MIASAAVRGLVPLLIIAAVACDNADPVAVQATDRASVRIDGPSEIAVRGTYSWTAILSGADAADEDFHWEVSWVDSDEAALHANGRVLSIDADPRRGRIELKVTVTANGHTASAAQVIAPCGDAGVEDDAIIPECELQYF